MSSEFTEKYFQPCVREFVSTVLLIDDQLSYMEPVQPSLEQEHLVIPQQGVVQPYVENNALVFPSSDDSKRQVYVTDLIKSFSKEGLLVTPINPKTLGAQNKEDCIKILLALAAKSDVIILDWDMNVSFTEGDSFSSEKLSKELINRLNADNKYRLIMIYTADKEQDVKNTLPETSNIKINIYGKSNTTGTVVKEYNELAKQVNIDFLAEKEGLLGSALLTSLSALRKSTYSMLNTLNKDYDEALLYHRMLLSDPDKITDFCKDIINDEIFAHIESASIESFFTKDAFLKFITDYGIKIIAKKTIDSSASEISNEDLTKLLENGYTAFFDKHSQALISRGENLDLLIQSDKEEIMKSFSYYTTMLSGDIKTNLKLGCIVKKDNDYFLCIQPPCDSERIEKLDISGKCKKPQKFLFLKLIKRDVNVSFFVKENSLYQGLGVKYKSVETFLFAGDSDGFVSQNKDGDFITYSPDNNSITLKYICRLKSMFAQKIANNFAANISRVGIDQFEWLRLKGRD